MLAEFKDLFKQNAAALFEDSFLVLTTTQTKQENFQILRQLQTADENQNGLAQLFNVVLNISAQVFR